MGYMTFYTLAVGDEGQEISNGHRQYRDPARWNSAVYPTSG